VKKLLVFDIDGTLTDSVRIHQQSFLKALSDFGIPSESIGLNNFKHHTDHYIFKQLYAQYHPDFSSDVLVKFEEKLTAYIQEEDPIEEIPGASDLLRNLQRDENTCICFATGSLKGPALLKLNALGLDYAFDLLVCSNDFEEREAIVEKAIEQAQLYYKQNRFDRIISIGDGLWDLRTAKTVGLEFIGIGNTHKSRLETEGMKLHFKDMCSFYIPKQIIS
jgi:phosphoglycolate phosphatase-like HAD superfamily hydrolase